MKCTKLCFLILCFTLFLTTAWADGSKLVALDARLDIISGQVKLTRVGSARTDIITQSVELFPGDLLETLRESKATLVYGDGTVMRIKERTLIEIQALSLKLFKGKTWYKFTKRGTEFKIETPTLVAGIRGTEFEVSVGSRKRTSISVTEGAVAVKSRQSNRGVLLRSGFATHCDADSDLVRPYKFNVELKNAEWASADWQANDDTNDLNRLFIRYLNLKYEYGDSDSKTQDALKQLEAVKKQQK
ncbi:MAG: FecR domain-containing protein [Candidatus Riflebacteria bacterium]|nr:FecR domain-containing protein [Candidatus Riflebacteria bacterium]